MRTTLRQNDLCFFEWASELLAPASHMPKISPIVTRLHSFEINFWSSKINWANVDKVILVSHAMERKLLKLHPELSGRTTVIYNGVDLKKFTPAENTPFCFNLGMLCVIHPIKRIYETILMVHGLVQQGYPVRLHIGGGRWPDGYHDDYYYAVHGLVDKLELHPYVIFDGPISDTPGWLRNIDIFISNSYWEGQQVALLEALACGCYCLSHFWDGAEEVLPADNIYGTEKELQEKVIEYACLPDAAKWERRAAMRAIAELRFNIEQTKANVSALIASFG
jgi:glycosyltransferase involved in cell wall biosynthesis